MSNQYIVLNPMIGQMTNQNNNLYTTIIQIKRVMIVTSLHLLILNTKKNRMHF